MKRFFQPTKGVLRRNTLLLSQPGQPGQPGQPTQRSGGKGLRRMVALAATPLMTADKAALVEAITRKKPQQTQAAQPTQPAQPTAPLAQTNPMYSATPAPPVAPTGNPFLEKRRRREW